MYQQKWFTQSMPKLPESNDGDCTLADIHSQTIDWISEKLCGPT